MFTDRICGNNKINIINKTKNKRNYFNEHSNFTNNNRNLINRVVENEIAIRPIVLKIKGNENNRSNNELFNSTDWMNNKEIKNMANNSEFINGAEENHFRIVKYIQEMKKIDKGFDDILFQKK